METTRFEMDEIGHKCTYFEPLKIIYTQIIIWLPSVKFPGAALRGPRSMQCDVNDEMGSCWADVDDSEKVMWGEGGAEELGMWVPPMIFHHGRFD